MLSISEVCREGYPLPVGFLFIKGTLTTLSYHFKEKPSLQKVGREVNFFEKSSFVGFDIVRSVPLRMRSPGSRSRVATKHLPTPGLELTA